jgi:hypothetical protein
VILGLVARRPQPLRLALVLAILVSAGLFAIGSAIERNQQDEHPGEARASESVPAPESGEKAHSETGESSESVGGESSETGGETHSESSEEIFGIDPESTGLVIAAIVAAVLLALAVWVAPLPPVLLAVIAFGVVFAAFDVREVVHQVDESREGLVIVAAILALLHALVAVLGLVVWRSPTARSPAAASG